MHSFGCCCFPSGRRSEIPGHASPIRESRMATSYRPSSCQKGRGWARVRGHSKGSQSVSQRDRPQGSRDCGFRTGPSRRQRQKLIQHRWRCRLFLMLLCLDRRDLFCSCPWHDSAEYDERAGPRLQLQLQSQSQGQEMELGVSRSPHRSPRFCVLAFLSLSALLGFCLIWSCS